MITIYRVQDSRGRGPFKPGFSDKWVDDNARAFERPSIMQDFGFDFMKHANPGECVGCGFLSVEDLTKWFSVTERFILRQHGYVLAEVPDCRIILQSPTQILFGRRLRFNVGVKTSFLP